MMARGVGNWLDDFFRYNSWDAWTTAAADTYSRVQYGQTPPVLRPRIGETPQQFGERQRDFIEAQRREGNWNENPNFGITADDVMARYGGFVDEVKEQKDLIVLVAVIGGLLFVSTLRR